MAVGPGATWAYRRGAARERGFATLLCLMTVCRWHGREIVSEMDFAVLVGPFVDGAVGYWG
jgi:hypothetical protein